MQYRNFGKLGIKVSAFGLGCMRLPMIWEGTPRVDTSLSTPIIRRAIDGGVNYIDTAYVYSAKKNEEAVGEALSGGYRDKVYLATKLPVWCCDTAADMERIFNEQIAALKTDYIDFYLLHSVDADNWKRAEELGAVEFIQKLKKDGRIKYACFSFHGDYPLFETVMNRADWDMCQLQYNYIDTEIQATHRGVKLAGERNIPVVIMEGLRGGRLAKVPDTVENILRNANPRRSAVEWAFRWLCGHSEIGTVLSGMSDMEMCEDNLRIFSDDTIGEFSDGEFAVMKEAAAEFERRIRVGCTGCRYCMPCPAGVQIPDIFSLWNDAYRYGENTVPGYKSIYEKGGGIDKCVECRACTEHCPQSLDIPTLLKEMCMSVKLS